MSFTFGHFWTIWMILVRKKSPNQVLSKQQNVRWAKSSQHLHPQNIYLFFNIFQRCFFFKSWSNNRSYPFELTRNAWIPPRQPFVLFWPTIWTRDREPSWGFWAWTRYWWSRNAMFCEKNNRFCWWKSLQKVSHCPTSPAARLELVHSIILGDEVAAVQEMCR